MPGELVPVEPFDRLGAAGIDPADPHFGRSGAEGSPGRDDLHQAVVGQAPQCLGDRAARDAVVLGQFRHGRERLPVLPFARVDTAPEVGLDPARR